MYYGIDLGTTNSLIGSGDKLYSGLVSSSVNVSTKSQCPRDIVSEDIVSSYKVNMTTGNEGKLPIACSSIILEELANQTEKRTNESIHDIVISVPAKFSHAQRTAVYESAKMAGLNCVGLINEPTAAAIYVCKDVKDLVVVYDLGGGTFDVSIVDTRAGNYYVVATDGRILAGDDFDNALVELAYEELKIKIRYRSTKLRKRLLYSMRLAKEELQKTKSSQTVDMSSYGCDKDFILSIDKYIDIMKKVFQTTIRLTNYLVESNLSNIEKPKLVFVGGSTSCPYLREWVCRETGLEEVKTDTNPDLIVAKGVALYAEMLFNGRAQEEVDDVTKRLCIEDDMGRSITIIEKNTTIPVTEMITVFNPKDCEVLEINLYQGDSIFCKDNEYIGTLVYDYKEKKKAGEGYIDVQVTVNRDGLIDLSGIDLLTNEEQNIRIIRR